MIVLLLLVASVCLFVGLAGGIWISALLGHPEFLHRSARAEVDLYRVGSSLRSDLVKRQIRLDGRRGIRQVQRDLDRLADEKGEAL